MTPEDLKRAEQLAKEGDGLVIKDMPDLDGEGMPVFVGDKFKIETETVEVKKPVGSVLDFHVHVITPEEADERADATAKQCLATDEADRCYSHHMVDWDKSRGGGYTVIRVLEFLNGLPFDNLAISYIHALRPSAIRATFGEVTCDAWTWRVTVFLEEPPEGWNKETKKPTPLIRYIEQEVEVKFGCGYDVGANLRWRKGGPPPKACPSVIGHSAGLEKADFS